MRPQTGRIARGFLCRLIGRYRSRDRNFHILLGNGGSLRRIFDENGEKTVLINVWERVGRCHCGMDGFARGFLCRLIGR